MKQIESSELPQYGIRTNHNIMDNGERRFRLSGADGSCYIRTEAAEDSGWQNSHYHTRLSELCIVQEGWVIYAELIGGKVEASKYTAGETAELCPAPIPAEKADLLQKWALLAFRALGLRDYARIDFKENAEGVPHFLEANTLPGMTETSLFPLAAATAGITFPALCTHMAMLAAERKNP